MSNTRSFFYHLWSSSSSSHDEESESASGQFTENCIVIEGIDVCTTKPRISVADIHCTVVEDTLNLDLGYRAILY